MKKLSKIWADLLRVFVGPLKHGKKEADGATLHVSESSQLLVGIYTTGEAKRLLDRFTAQGVEFDIKSDVRGPTESDDGSYVDQPRISIFVNRADAQRAAELITEARREGI